MDKEPGAIDISDGATFASVLAAANESRTGRNPGQWTPAASKTWREADPKMSRLLDAAIALELTLNRKVTTGDEDIVREQRAQMDAATAAIKANA
ncbi:hypothetical protein GGE65_007278 [Skermanella aerolata]|uniref:hypothetical protein n=1 Tax=Skermanella aerolata TaxID=393310 RepID=UPI003D21B349